MLDGELYWVESMPGSLRYPCPSSNTPNQQWTGADFGYLSDPDESMARKRFSREDFKEQYCINQRALDVLDKSRSTVSLFGCLSSYQESPCKKRDNFFTSCYGRHPSDENISLPPKRRWRDEYCSSGDEGGFDSKQRPRSVAVSRESLYNEAKRFTWNEQMERYVEKGSASDWRRRPAGRYPSAPVTNIESTRKHVSFDTAISRSATSNSFDEFKIRRAKVLVGEERLLDGRKTPELLPIEKPKRTLKSQSTQTDTYIVRASGPPPYLSLSPRTSYRVRMVSQGAQTNGFCVAPGKQLSTSLKNFSTSTTPSSAGESLRPMKPRLQKTLSDGEILLERKKAVTTAFLDVDLENTKSEEALVKYRVIEDEEHKLDEEMFHEKFLFGYGDKVFDSLEESCLSSSSGSYSILEDRISLRRSPAMNFVSTLPSPPTECSDFLPPPPPPPLEDEEEPLFDEEIPVVRPPEGWADESSSNGQQPKKKKKKKASRAKSEERVIRSSDAATQSSISLHASLHDLSTIDDDDSGIYMEPYTLGIWIYIGENEELLVWKKKELERVNSGGSTVSEREFRKKFTALTHRMVHRKASGETYRRLANNTLEINKKVRIKKDGEFGFRIHGSRPVVVSAVESDTPAEESGLEVGDVILSINGVSVLEASHSDVVKLAKSDLLELELARTADLLDVDDEQEEDIENQILKAGNILKKIGEEEWVERYFVLKADNTIYYYRDNESKTPLGAVSLLNANLKVLSNEGDDFIFEIKKNSSHSIILSLRDESEMDLWVDSISRSIQKASQDDKWVALSGKYVMGPSHAIPNSDCFGVLSKLGRRLKTWTRRFCVLKDACIYFFISEEVSTALGAAHLHGYRVQTVSLGGKKHAFELVPPNSSMRHYYLATDNEHDRKRWLASLEYSIERWINVSRSQ